MGPHADQVTNGLTLIITKLKASPSPIHHSKGGASFPRLEMAGAARASSNRMQMVAKHLLRLDREYSDFLNRTNPLNLGANVPGRLVAEAEGYFCFHASAYEMLAWCLNYIHPTTIPSDLLSFERVLQELANPPVNNQIKGFKQANDGWLNELRRYRDFIVHRGHLPFVTGVLFGGSGLRIKRLLLPENPKATKLRYKRKELLPYAEKRFISGCQLVGQILDYVASQM